MKCEFCGTHLNEVEGKERMMSIEGHPVCESNVCKEKAKEYKIKERKMLAEYYKTRDVQLKPLMEQLETNMRELRKKYMA